MFSTFLRRHRIALLLTLLIILVTGLGVSIKLHKTAAKQPAPQKATSINASTPGSGSTNPSPDKQTSGVNVPTIPSDKSTSSSPTTLMVPFGNFVSNHRPSLSGPAATHQEQSVCNTTSGASCFIQFSNGEVTKKLDAQSTDSNGSAYWTWDVAQSGLSPGSWTITAVASLNGQTQTAQDSIPLVVQQ